MTKIHEKLLNIQRDLKAPKGQYNSFGKYKYRSCEDILEAVKPLLAREKCTLTIVDDLIECGGRIYIRATATLEDIEAGGPAITTSALAREPVDKKGMDESQITGMSSSYARKYCLNGLFLIDDTKDADTEEHANEVKSKAEKSKGNKPEKVNTEQIDALMKRYPRKDQIDNILQHFNLTKLEDMTVAQLSELINAGGKK